MLNGNDRSVLLQVDRALYSVAIDRIVSTRRITQFKESLKTAVRIAAVLIVTGLLIHNIAQFIDLLDTSITHSASCFGIRIVKLSLERQVVLKLLEILQTRQEDILLVTRSYIAGRHRHKDVISCDESDLLSGLYYIIGHRSRDVVP